MTMKRGTRVECSYAMGGKVVQGTVLKVEPINLYAKHGVDLWYAVEMIDEHGSYKGCVHHTQVRNVDNRPSFRA